MCVYLCVIFLSQWQNPNTSGVDPRIFFFHIIYVPRKHQEGKDGAPSFTYFCCLLDATGSGGSSTCSVYWLNVREIKVPLFYLEDTYIGPLLQHSHSL